ncbi:MAG: mercury methylation corrinoid protein HgcA [Spirochaetota bacterium]
MASRFTPLSGSSRTGSPGLLPGAPPRTAADPDLPGFAPLGDRAGPWVTGYLAAGYLASGYLASGKRSVPLVSTRLALRDRLGNLGVRLGARRNRHRVAAGLYALGRADPASPVLVTSNYKLTFDSLRKELSGIDAWILVLDTRGVNVWCAAGKGSFGTAELISKVSGTRLGDVVEHRELILPQLGAPGVAAREVRLRTGFRVLWGPVLAADIRAYLAAGKRKTPRMSVVRFALRDRLVLAPIELVHSWPVALAALALGLLAGAPWGPGWMDRALASTVFLEVALLLATLGFPALLFVLPFRGFAPKGAVLGAAWGCVASLSLGLPLGLGAGLTLISIAGTAWIGLNFTGSTTFTSPTGALLEVERSLWPCIATLALGLGLSVLSRITGF